MAEIASVESLVERLSSLEKSQLAWLDPEQGLLVGVYPQANWRFDFASEKLQPLAGSSEPKAKTRFSKLAEARRVGARWEVETDDAIYLLGSATQMLVFGLDLIEEMRPGTLEKLSRQKARSKRPVARSRADLYDVPHPESHSERLKSGFFVATNNTSAEARKFLRNAAELAGFTWGVDFVARPAPQAARRAA